MDSDDIDALLAAAESQGMAYDFSESEEDGEGIAGTGAASVGDGYNENGHSPAGAAPASDPARQAADSEDSSEDDLLPTQCTISHYVSQTHYTDMFLLQPVSSLFLYFCA